MSILKKFHQLQLKNRICIPFYSILFQKKKINYHLKNHFKRPEAYSIFQDFSEVPNDELVLGRQSSLLHVVLKKLRLDIMKHLQWRTHTKTYEDMCPLLILNFLNWLVLVSVMFLWFITRHIEKTWCVPV